MRRGGCLRGTGRVGSVKVAAERPTDRRGITGVRAREGERASEAGGVGGAPKDRGQTPSCAPQRRARRQRRARARGGRTEWTPGGGVRDPRDAGDGARRPRPSRAFARLNWARWTCGGRRQAGDGRACRRGGAGSDRLGCGLSRRRVAADAAGCVSRARRRRCDEAACGAPGEAAGCVRRCRLPAAREAVRCVRPRLPLFVLPCARGRGDRPRSDHVTCASAGRGKAAGSPALATAGANTCVARLAHTCSW